MFLFAETDVGASAVEFAILLPVFIAMVLAIFEISIICLAKAELDMATQMTARQLMTGGLTSTSQLQSSLCANIAGLITCNKLMISLQPYATLASMSTSSPTLAYNANGTVSNNWQQNLGSSGSIMVLQVVYQFPVIGGPLFNFADQTGGSAEMVSTYVFINE